MNTNNPTTAWGPEVEYARAWAKDHPGERLHIAKNVKGATGLAADPRAPDWSPDSSGELFDKATARLSVAKAQIPDLTDITIVYVQGEEDANHRSKAAA